MLLLGLDTATPVVTVAVGDGVTVLARRDLVPAATGPGGRAPSPRHGEQLAPAVRDVLAEAAAAPEDLTHVVCGVGPGPFTGVRVGVVSARMLGLALGIPVAGLCTLDALAAEADGACLAVLDARRREVYVAAYDDDRRRTWGPRVLRPADVAAALGGALASAAPRVAVGPGARLHAHTLTASGLAVDGPAEVAAAALLALAAPRLEAGDPVPAAVAYAVSEAAGDGRATVVPEGLLAPEPLYLRRPDAVPSVPVPSVPVPPDGDGGGP